LRATKPQKISFLGGPAHFVTYGDGDDGDGLVDNNNALTAMASALKISIYMKLLGQMKFSYTACKPAIF
jgi:hypothetical protein